MLKLRQARAAKMLVLKALSAPTFKKYHAAVGVELPFDEQDERYRVAVRLPDEVGREAIEKRIDQLGVAPADLSVTVIGSFHAAVPAPKPQLPSDQLRIGASISHSDGGAGAGTLGFFAERNGVRGFVSCNHVIAKADAAKRGDKIISPGGNDGGNAAHVLAGTLTRVVGLTKKRFHQGVDCAFASVEQDRWPIHPGSLGIDGVLSSHHATIRRGLRVIKQGRSTDRSTGRIRACWIDSFPVQYGKIIVRFDDVFEIESIRDDGVEGQAPPDEAAEMPTFCDAGDSGALIYTRIGDMNHPVGLLFAEKATGGVDNSGFGYGNPILKVTRALGVTLVVK